MKKKNILRVVMEGVFLVLSFTLIIYMVANFFDVKNLKKSSKLQLNSTKAEVYKFDDVLWEPSGTNGVEMALLWGREEDSSAVYAFRIQPGVSISNHTHTKDYWGLSVQGKWIHTDSNGKKIVTDQDSFVRIKGGDLHSDTCAGPEVCINIVDFDGARDISFS